VSQKNPQRQNQGGQEVLFNEGLGASLL